jgi:hypothetical protein
MKKLFSYNLLLIIAVVLDRVVVSILQIDATESLRPLFILLFLTIIADLIIQQVIKDWYRSDFIVFAALMMWMAYRALFGWFKLAFPSHAYLFSLLLIPITVWLYFLSISTYVWKSIRNPKQLTSYFYIVLTLMLIFQAVRFVGDFDGLSKHGIMVSASTITSSVERIQLDPKTRPDIYVIVLDGYARQDVLNKMYDYDNSEFINWLDERGFYIADESHSNYVQTPYSMASFWNMDYLPTWDTASDYDAYLYQPIQDNLVFRLLDEIGYTTVSTEGEVHYTEIRNSDVYLSDFLPLNDFESFILQDSPFESLSNVFNMGLPLQTYKTHSQRIYYQFEQLKKIPVKIPDPKIVYVHILAPHPPFVFDHNGGILTYQKPFTLAEGAGSQGGSDQYVNGYREQVEFINSETMKSIDGILAASETPPIILVMGDHGPSSKFNFDIENPGCVWERTSNLFAVLLPGHKDDGTLYSSITPVNAFRVIFNAYFGTELPLQKDSSYMRFWQQPTLNVDRTSQRDSLEGCGVPTD